MEKAGEAVVVNGACDFLFMESSAFVSLFTFYFSLICTMCGFGDGDVTFVWLLGRDVPC